MDYNQLIEEVKKDLDDYSFDDSEYKKIFDSAYGNLEKSYNESRDALERSYYNERRKATAENALETKNLSEELAARGLGRSGESALLKINQAASLNNSLNDLAENNVDEQAKLLSDFHQRSSELDESYAKTVSDKTESEKKALYERLEHLENLSEQEAKRKADEEKWRAELNQERYALEQKLNAEAGKTDTEQEDGSKGTLKEKLSSLVKWGSNLFSSIIKNASAEKTESEETVSAEEGLVPSVAPQTMGNNILLRYLTDGKLTEFGKSGIYSELARLIATSNLDKTYAEEVLAVLRSQGFDFEFSVELASSDYVKRGYEIYYRIYEEYYNGMTEDGEKESYAHKTAAAKAEEAIIEYIKKLYITTDKKKAMLRMYDIY